MNLTVPPRPSSNERQDRAINRLLEGELLDLYAAVLIIVPIAFCLRFL